jgi:hypothetical protein
LDCVCVIAAPQTGAAYLCKVLENFPDLASYPEVFSAGGMSRIDSEAWPLLRQATGLDIVDGQDTRPVAYARENPAAWLDALAEAARGRGKRIMSFPLLRGDLTPDVIEADVAARPGLRLVLVVRKQIDSFVSWRRSVELGKWRGVGIGAGRVRLKLEVDGFERWLDAQERWYEHWRHYLGRRFMPCPVLRYEVDIDQPPERVLRRFAAAAGQVGIALRLPATIDDSNDDLRDTDKALADRVANWADFNRAIFARGLERRAFGYPI